MTFLMDEINKITKNKFEKLTGLPNLDQCDNHCEVNYMDTNAIVSTENNEYTIDYEHIGVYDLITQTWYWAWGFYPNEKQKIILSKEIKKNIIKMIKDANNKLTQDEEELFAYFIKNSIYVEKENLEMLVKLCVYTLRDKIEWIMPYKKNMRIYFIAIKKIISSK